MQLHQKELDPRAPAQAEKDLAIAEARTAIPCCGSSGPERPGAGIARRRAGVTAGRDPHLIHRREAAGSRRGLISRRPRGFDSRPCFIAPRPADPASTSQDAAGALPAPSVPLRRDSSLPRAAHAAWNALARLELMIRARTQERDEL